VERENKNGHIKRDLSIILLGTFLGTGVGTLLVDRGGDCTGKSEFDGKHKEIAACVNTDNRIEIILATGEKRLLPEGICRLTQIWTSKSEPNWISYFRYLDHGYAFEINGMNTDTGEIGEGMTFTLPAQFVDTEDKKELICEK
jgi:hypothetical protein